MDTEHQNNPIEYLETGMQSPVEIGAHKFSYQDVEALLQVMYNQGEKGPREVDIVNEYIKHLSKVEEYEYSYDDKQPTVHKALKKLVGENKVLKENRRYYLVQPDNTKEIAEKTLLQNVRLYKKSVFIISRSTIVLYPTEATIDVAKEWLTKYLGSSCYGIAKHDGYLFIMLVGKKDVLDQLRTDIKNLAEAIYKKHAN